MEKQNELNRRGAEFNRIHLFLLEVYMFHLFEIDGNEFEILLLRAE